MSERELELSEQDRLIDSDCDLDLQLEDISSPVFCKDCSHKSKGICDMCSGTYHT